MILNVACVIFVSYGGVILNKNEQIGLRIKASREKEGLTQKQLGKAIGRTESAIRKYEKGLIEVPLSILEKISHVLNTNTASLTGWEELIKQKNRKLDLTNTRYELEAVQKELNNTEISEEKKKQLLTIMNSLVMQYEKLRKDTSCLDATLEQLKHETIKPKNINTILDPLKYEGVQKQLMNKLNHKDTSIDFAESIQNEIMDSIINVPINAFVFFISTAFPEYKNILNDKQDIEDLYYKVADFTEFNIKKMIEKNNN